MADIEKVILIIQGKVQNRTSEYKPVIEAALAGVFSEMGARYELSWLRSPEPEVLAITTGVQVYTVSAKVGRMLYISSSKYGRKVVGYVPREQFDDYLEETAANSTGSPAKFTDFGVSSKKKVIVFDRVPVTATTWYLHYQLEATYDRISYMPESWIKTLIHGAMSILAPPIERQSKEGILWWQTVTKYEDVFYEQGLARLIGQARPAAFDIPTPALDPIVHDRLEEINQT